MTQGEFAATIQELAHLGQSQENTVLIAAGGILGLLSATLSMPDSKPFAALYEMVTDFVTMHPEGRRLESEGKLKIKRAASVEELMEKHGDEAV